MTPKAAREIAEKIIAIEVEIEHAGDNALRFASMNQSGFSRDLLYLNTQLAQAYGLMTPETKPPLP